MFNQVSKAIYTEKENQMVLQQVNTHMNRKNKPQSLPQNIIKRPTHKGYNFYKAFERKYRRKFLCAGEMKRFLS